jgi:hypothetical protein
MYIRTMPVLWGKERKTWVLRRLPLLDGRKLTSLTDPKLSLVRVHVHVHYSHVHVHYPLSMFMSVSVFPLVSTVCVCVCVCVCGGWRVKVVVSVSVSVSPVSRLPSLPSPVSRLHPPVLVPVPVPVF